MNQYRCQSCGDTGIMPVGLDDGRRCEDCPPPLMAGGFVDSDGVTWPTCPQCGKTHPCAELPPEQAEQIAQWERELAQYSHRSDSTGFAGRIGEEVLRALWRARLANAVLDTAYRRSIEKRLELERYIAVQEALNTAAHTEGVE